MRYNFGLYTSRKAKYISSALTNNKSLHNMILRDQPAHNLGREGRTHNTGIDTT